MAMHRLVRRWGLPLGIAFIACCLFEGCSGMGAPRASNELDEDNYAYYGGPIHGGTTSMGPGSMGTMSAGSGAGTGRGSSSSAMTNSDRVWGIAPLPPAWEHPAPQ